MKLNMPSRTTRNVRDAFRGPDSCAPQGLDLDHKQQLIPCFSRKKRSLLDRVCGTTLAKKKERTDGAQRVRRRLSFFERCMRLRGREHMNPGFEIQPQIVFSAD